MNAIEIHDLWGVPELIHLKEHDYITYMHSIRVFQLTLSFGLSLKFNSKQLEELAMGALAHDIGKMLVPLEILNKPGRLTSDEFKIIQNHPLDGLNIAVGLPLTSRKIIVQHHECIDGSGYPKGLNGKDIHDFAKIVTLVDVYEALKSDRPYSPPWKDGDVVNYIKQYQGKKFDWEITNLFLENFCHTKATP